MIEFDDDWNWLRVLRTHPERADEFKGWNRLGGFNIARVLEVQPQLARYCDLKKLKPMAWFRLLRKQPQFAPQCDKWEEIRKFAPALVERLQDAQAESCVRRWGQTPSAAVGTIGVGPG